MELLVTVLAILTKKQHSGIANNRKIKKKNKVFAIIGFLV
jgi:hypothetical protein